MAYWFRQAAIFLLLVACLGVSVTQVQRQNRPQVHVEMQVTLPLFVQVVMAMGDRYLAANVGSIRALVVATEKMTPDQYKVLAKVHEDVSWLNRGHEDNYYIATNILPWNGQIEQTQRILARATHARPFDYQPAFLYAFNQLHFYGDAVGASAWLRMAAEKLPDDQERLIMQNFAARWIDLADDTDLAISVVSALAKQAKRDDFRAYLEKRVERLHLLKQLRQAAARYVADTGQAPRSFEQLIDKGLIDRIPEDPFGFGFQFDKKGRIVLRTGPPRK
jgi:hypothetical protein